MPKNPGGNPKVKLGNKPVKMARPKQFPDPFCPNGYHREILSPKSPKNGGVGPTYYLSPGPLRIKF